MLQCVTLMLVVAHVVMCCYVLHATCCCVWQNDDVAIIARQFGRDRQLEPHLVKTLTDFLQREYTKRL